MNKLEQIKELEEQYAKLEEEKNNLVRPLYIKNQERLSKAKELFEKDYAKVEDEINIIHNKQIKIEEYIEQIEDTMPHCKWCGKPVDEYDKDALKDGFEYCRDCYLDLDVCETCGDLGQQGVNTEANNIYTCYDCGETYCDNCYHECPEEEEDE